MKNSKKKIYLFVLLSIILAGGYFLVPQVVNYFRWTMAVEAASGFPHQIGLTEVIIDPCIPDPLTLGTTCTSTTNPSGKPLCFTKDIVRCALYSYVEGTQAGGMGNNALFLNTAIAKAGLAPGGQLIAGGNSPVAMDSGALASVGGCYGCYAKADNMKDKIEDFFNTYIIAGFKD